MQIGPKKAPKDQKTFTYHLANFLPVFKMALPRVILDPKNAQQQHKESQNPKFFSKKCPKGHFVRAVPGKVANILGDRYVHDTYVIPKTTSGTGFRSWTTSER